VHSHGDTVSIGLRRAAMPQPAVPSMSGGDTEHDDGAGPAVLAPTAREGGCSAHVDEGSSRDTQVEEAGEGARACGGDETALGEEEGTVLGLSQINAVRKDPVAASVAARFDVVSALPPPGCVPTLAKIPELEGMDAFAIDGECLQMSGCA